MFTSRLTMLRLLCESTMDFKDKLLLGMGK